MSLSAQRYQRHHQPREHGAEFSTSSEEDNILYDHACDRADEDLAEYFAEAAEYRAEMRREDRWMREAAE